MLEEVVPSLRIADCLALLTDIEYPAQQVLNRVQGLVRLIRREMVHLALIYLSL